MNTNLFILKQNLRRYGIHLSKQRGQTILIDESVLSSIVAASELTEKDIVLEIGAGTGILTKILAQQANQVYAIEFDKRMFHLATDTLRGYANITLIQEDVLDFDFYKFFAMYSNQPIKIVGNLPYSITTPILMKVVESNLQFPLAVFMMQKEVAERINAEPGTKEYGILTIAITYRMQVELVRFVTAKSFFPVPAVDSAIIKLVPYQTPPVKVDDDRFFFRIVKVAFSQRRKTLLNTLNTISHQLGLNKPELEAILKELEIDPQRRGETLSLAEYAELANFLNRIRSKMPEETSSY